MCPARISEDISEQVRETAVKVYRAMECRGMARVDFFVRRDDQEVVFNEINTIPGFTSISMYPRLFGGKRHRIPGADRQSHRACIGGIAWYNRH